MTTIRLRIGLVVAGLVIAFASLVLASRQDADEAIGIGCDIPKSFGRLVALIDAAQFLNAQGTPGPLVVGQAVFEDIETGTIRWVLIMTRPGPMQVLPPERHPYPGLVPPPFRGFECSLGPVWKRH